MFQTGRLLKDAPSLLSVKLPDLPIATSSATGVVIARNIYICGGVSGDLASAPVVLVYDLDKATWSKLPPAPQYDNEAVAINNQLVLIGGCEASSHTISNIVSTWTGQDWKQDLPEMPTKRFRAGVTTYGTYVIVAGGMAEDEQTLLSSIDLLDTTTRQWCTASNLQLPQLMFCIQITVNATHICVTSASIAYDATTTTTTSPNKVWQLPVSTLAKALTNEDCSPHQWAVIASTPHYCSALVQGTDHLLAVGGRDDAYEPTANIAICSPHGDKWTTVGQLLEPRLWCTVVGLSTCSFLVCGGRSDARDKNTRLKSVEVVSNDMK